MASMPLYEPLISKPELARRLDISISCIDRWIKARRIPVYNLGDKCIRFDFVEVRTALAKFERPALRRFARSTYRPRRRFRHQRLQQLMLPIQPDDPAQGLFPFMDSVLPKAS
jgi:predicted DNA-binding transcriptional regulator AlpA